MAIKFKDISLLIRKAFITGGEKIPVSDTEYITPEQISGESVKFTEQSLTDEQKAQARRNTGAGTYSKPSGGIPSSDLTEGVQTALGKAGTAYQKPAEGIPSSDMAEGVRTSLGKADTAFQKPADGIPSTDFTEAVQTALEKADTALQSETDPTVPSWAKEDSKPSYTAQEVGALPDTTKYAGSPSIGGPATKALAIPFGKVDDTSTATAMTATVDNFPTQLSAGVCALVMNGVVASAEGWTLNINNTGALPVYGTMSAASRTTTLFSASYTMLFVYNPDRVEGGCWDAYYGYYSSTNSIGYQVRTNSMQLVMKEKVYRYRLLFTSADGLGWEPANTSTSTNATASRTVNQNKIDPFGSIVYYSSTTALSAGGSPGTGTQWQQYILTIGYSFNRTGAAQTMTAKRPVYVKCAPQTDGSAIIDADTPYVQALPTTKDGKIYIFLGVATSATQIELNIHHPVYYFDGTRRRIWTGESIE